MQWRIGDNGGNEQPNGGNWYWYLNGCGGTLIRHRLYTDRDTGGNDDIQCKAGIRDDGIQLPEQAGSSKHIIVTGDNDDSYE